MRRILALPTRTQDTPVAGVLPTGWEDRLRAVQVRALMTLGRQPAPLGLYGDVPVGEGKFLIALLAPTIVGAARPLVLTESGLVPQALRELERFEPLFPGLVVPDFLGYEMLSQTKNYYILEDRRPDLIVLDEAHHLCSLDSARTQRVIRYAQLNPWCRFVVLSGTLSRKSLLDVAHLVELALREQSWLPLDRNVLTQWAEVIDHGAKPGKDALALLEPLRMWAGTGDTLEAYRARYLTAPGVIAPKETALGVGLQLRRWNLPTPAPISEAIKRLSEDWELPDGTELVESLEYFRHGDTLSVGFYYKSIYPDDPATEIWREARRAWGRALTKQIRYLKWPGLDSPARVETACRECRAAPDVVAAWTAWDVVRDTVTATQETIWLTHDAVDAVVMRAKAKGRCLIWYRSRAVGEALAARGIEVFGAGTDAPPDRTRIAALSMRTHGVGKNLQAWSDQIIMEPPSNAVQWEQLLGRTHRPGQTADRVSADVLCATWLARANLLVAMNEADYFEQTSNKRQKLLYADWIP